MFRHQNDQHCEEACGICHGQIAQCDISRSAESKVEAGRTKKKPFLSLSEPGLFFLGGLFVFAMSPPPEWQLLPSRTSRESRDHTSVWQYGANVRLTAGRELWRLWLLTTLVRNASTAARGLGQIGDSTSCQRCNQISVVVLVLVPPTRCVVRIWDLTDNFRDPVMLGKNCSLLDLYLYLSLCLFVFVLIGSMKKKNQFLGPTAAKLPIFLFLFVICFHAEINSLNPKEPGAHISEVLRPSSRAAPPVPSCRMFGQEISRK